MHIEASWILERLRFVIEVCMNVYLTSLNGTSVLQTTLPPEPTSSLHYDLCTFQR